MMFADLWERDLEGRQEDIPRLKTQMITKLEEKAEGRSFAAPLHRYMLMALSGMFLYVMLVMKGLMAQTNSSDLQATINRLPQGLDQTYVLPYYYNCRNYQWVLTM